MISNGDMGILLSILFPRALSSGFLDYLTRIDDITWEPDHAYFCSLIGRLVDSILSSDYVQSRFKVVRSKFTQTLYFSKIRELSLLM